MINLEELSQLCNELGCRIIPDCCLAEYTTFRFGGACRALISINSAESAKTHKIHERKSLRYDVIGRGSNLIVSDEGYDGIILRSETIFPELR